MDDLPVSNRLMAQRSSKQAAAGRRLSEGFRGQSWHMASGVELRQAELDPITMDFYPTDVGWFPRAHHHYRERPQGADEHILIFCVAGSGWFELDGGRRPVSRGDAFVIPKGMAHRYGANSLNPWSIYWAHFKGRTAPLYASYFASGDGIVSVRTGVSAKVGAIFRDCCRSSEGIPEFAWIVVASHALRHVLSLILFSDRTRPALADLSEGPDFTECLAFMRQNVGRDLSLGEIARKAGLSVSRFSARFKARTGLSPIEFFIRLRMQSAGVALLTTRLSVKEIAGNLGYADPYYFSRLFRRTMGLPPSTYRRFPKG